MTSVPLRPVPTITSVRSAAAKPAGAVSAFWDTCHGLRASYQQNRAWVQCCAVVGVVVGAFGLWLAHFAVVMMLLLGLWFVMVVWAWRQKHHDAVESAEATGDPFPYRWDYPRRWLGMMLLGPVGTLTVLTYAWAHYALRWPLCELASVCSVFGIVLVLAVMEQPVDEEPSRWEEQSLRDAFVAAGAIKGGFTRLGPPQRDETGEWQTLKLAPGETWQDVAKTSSSLASALDVEEDMLTVEHAGGPPNTVRVRITERAEVVVKREPCTSPLVTVERTDWRQPLRIGVDQINGESVYLPTDQHNILAAGLPGYGKTAFDRLPLVHFLKDPTTTIDGADGKGARSDYGALARFCRQHGQSWVWGTDEDAPEQLIAMLEKNLRLVRQRNEASEDAMSWPGHLLLLEEFQDIRAGGTKQERDQIDLTLGRIVRMGRAVSVVTLFSTQRPSVEDLPSGTRNLIDLRLSFYFRNPRDNELVIGYLPKHLPLPKAPGEAIHASALADSSVLIDFIDAGQFREAVAQGTLLRADRVDLGKPERETVTVTPPAPTLLGAVTQVLQAGEVQSALLFDKVAEMLPANLLPADASALGRALGKHAQFASRRTGTGTRWRLVAATSEPAVASNGPVLSVNGHQDGVPSLVKAAAVSGGGRQ